jgi:hypothetical protein
LLFGTKVQTSAPSSNDDMVTLRLGYAFRDFAVFPPKYSSIAGTVKNAFSGTGQLSLTGSHAIRYNLNMDRMIFQDFQTSDLSFNSDGTADYSSGGSNPLPGAGTDTQAHWSGADFGETSIVLGISIKF